MAYTIAQLKKMATERISRIFEKVYGYCVFNPYEEREYMIIALVGHYATEVIETVEIIGVILPVFNNDTPEIIGYNYYARISNDVISKVFASIRNQCQYEPVRTETKGRKSRFSFRDVMDMLNADIQGMRLTDIAKYYETSCAVVIQILTGNTYQWSSGITQESF